MIQKDVFIDNFFLFVCQNKFYAYFCNRKTAYYFIQ